MSTHDETVPIAPGGTLRVAGRSGKVEVMGEARADVLVERGRVASTTDEHEIAVERDSGAIRVRCPEGLSVLTGTDSGPVRLRGRLGRCRVTTGSGNIEVDASSDLDARTDSGNITVVDSNGTCRCQTGSGTLQVGRARDVDLVTGSGNVTARVVNGARVRAGSGTVVVELDDIGDIDIDIEIHSGNARVSVPRDARPALDLEARSGTVRSSLTAGTNGRIRVRAGSGNITIEAR